MSCDGILHQRFQVVSTRILIAHAVLFSASLCHGVMSTRCIDETIIQGFCPYGSLFTAASNWFLTRGFAVFSTPMNKPHDLRSCGVLFSVALINSVII